MRQSKFFPVTGDPKPPPCRAQLETFFQCPVKWQASGPPGVLMTVPGHSAKAPASKARKPEEAHFGHFFWHTILQKPPMGSSACLPACLSRAPHPPHGVGNFSLMLSLQSQVAQFRTKISGPWHLHTHFPMLRTACISVQLLFTLWISAVLQPTADKLGSFGKL